MTYSSDFSRVALVGNLLTGSALEWFSPMFESQDSILKDFDAFVKSLRDRFENPHRRTNAASRLYTLRQGRRPVSAYASEAQILLADAGWDDTAAQFAFLRGLNDDVRDLLLSMPEVSNLNGLIVNAVAAGNRIYQRALEKQNERQVPGALGTFFSPRTVVTTSVPTANTMQAANDAMILDATLPMNRGPRPGLTQEERSRRMEHRLCLYCAEPDHRIVNCPRRTNTQNLRGNDQGRQQ